MLSSEDEKLNNLFLHAVHRRDVASFIDAVHSVSIPENFSTNKILFHRLEIVLNFFEVCLDLNSGDEVRKNKSLQQAIESFINSIGATVSNILSNKQFETQESDKSFSVLNNFLSKNHSSQLSNSKERLFRKLKMYENILLLHEMKMENSLEERLRLLTAMGSQLSTIDENLSSEFFDAANHIHISIPAKFTEQDIFRQLKNKLAFSLQKLPVQLKKDLFEKLRKYFALSALCGESLTSKEQEKIFQQYEAVESRFRKNHSFFGDLLARVAGNSELAGLTNSLRSRSTEVNFQGVIAYVIEEFVSADIDEQTLDDLRKKAERSENHISLPQEKRLLAELLLKPKSFVLE
jgi:hypothetical protein